MLLRFCFARIAGDLPIGQLAEPEAPMHLVTFERSSAHRSLNEVGALGDAAMGFESLEPVRPGSRRLGAVLSVGTYAGWVVDLNRALAIRLAYDDVGAPEVEANSMVPSDMLSFLRLGPAALRAAKIALDFAIETLDCYNAPDFLRAGAVEPADRVRLCAPLPRPGTGKYAGRVKDCACCARWPTWIMCRSMISSGPAGRIIPALIFSFMICPGGTLPVRDSMSLGWLRKLGSP